MKMPIARKSTVILALVLAAFLIALIPKYTVAEGNADAEGARIGKLDCASGEIAKFDGSVWMCSPDDNTDTLGGLSCIDGQIAKFNGTVWECSPDDDTLGGLDDCNDGEVAQWNDSSGEWECAAVDGGGGPSDCPPGFVALNDKVCIEENDKGSTAIWPDANFNCIDANFRLCTVGEWVAACEKAIIFDTTGNWEWLDDNTGFANMALVGFGGCRSFASLQYTFTGATFRCCVDR
jgi:hypothetical protein